MNRYSVLCSHKLKASLVGDTAAGALSKRYSAVQSHIASLNKLKQLSGDKYFFRNLLYTMTYFKAAVKVFSSFQVKHHSDFALSLIRSSVCLKAAVANSTSDVQYSALVML